MENKKTAVVISLVLISVAIYQVFISPLLYFSKTPLFFLIGIGLPLAYTVYLIRNKKLKSGLNHTKDHTFSEIFWIILAIVLDIAIFFAVVGGVFGDCNYSIMYAIPFVSYLVLLRGIYVALTAEDKSPWLSLIAIGIYLSIAVALYYVTFHVAVFAFMWCGG